MTDKQLAKICNTAYWINPSDTMASGCYEILPIILAYKSHKEAEIFVLRFANKIALCNKDLDKKNAAHVLRQFHSEFSDALARWPNGPTND